MCQRMFFLSIFFAALITSFGCRQRSSNDSTLQAASSEDPIPTFYLGDTISKGLNPCISDLLNASSDAFSDGLLMNGALTGLGTNTPVGQKLSTDSLYFQMLRILSIFDWRFYDAMRSGEVKCLPSEVSFGYAHLPRAYVEGLPKAYVEYVNDLRKGLEEISRDAPEFMVVQAKAFYQPVRWPSSPAGDRNFLKAIEAAGVGKLTKIRRDSRRDDDVKVKLKAMVDGYMPLSLSYNALFPSTLQDRKMYLELYLPPLHELNIPSIDHPRNWRVVDGVKKRQLPRPVDISIARLTHFGYLQELSDKSEPVIKLQVYKDFAKPDEMVMRAIFGSVSQNGPELGYLPLEYRNYRSALYISLFPNLQITETDSSLVRRAKQEFNALVNVIRLDARIHQLTIEMKREPGQEMIRNGIDSVLLKPHFSMKDSDISFRMYLDTTSAVGRKVLETAGFSCGTQTLPETVAACYRDFGAYDELTQYVDNEDSGLAKLSESSSWANRFREGLNTLIRYNTRYLINWNISAIEKAIDLQFVELFEMIAKEQNEAQKKIKERLEREIFARSN